MQLKTRHFGEIEIDDNEIIHFPEGIPGFEQNRQFIILANSEDNNPFQWLQGVDDPDTALVIIDPKTFKNDYIVDVPDEEVAVLEIDDPSKVNVFTVVVVPDQISQMTANLRAPVLINSASKKGKQVIMESNKHPIKYYFMDELLKAGG